MYNYHQNYDKRNFLNINSIKIILSILKLLFIQIITLILDKPYFPQFFSPEAMINQYMKLLLTNFSFYNQWQFFHHKVIQPLIFNKLSLLPAPCEINLKSNSLTTSKNIKNQMTNIILTTLHGLTHVILIIRIRII